MISSCIASTVIRVDILPGVRSDHSMLWLTVRHVESSRRGRGYWKFNASLLKDKTYTDIISKCIEDTVIENNNLVDKGLLWDLIKCKIRGESITYAVKKKRSMQQRENEILKDIKEKERLLAEGQTSVYDELESLKSEFDMMQSEKAQGAIMMSKAANIEYGEKNTKFFLQLEKRNHEVKHIKSLKTHNDCTVTDPNRILEIEKDFYVKLYTEQNSLFDENNEFVANNAKKKISQTSFDLCEKPLDCDEFHKALLGMSNNKSPGNDGLTVEFYKFFWDNIKDLVTDSLNHAFQKGEMSIEQKRGVITLIPKKDKDLRYIKNWRPISLLNTDYKILTKALSSRLQVALPEIISSDQTGYIKGRYIGENIRVIQDIIDFTSLKNIKGYMLLLDFEKAFDSVNIKFLKRALQAYNFGPRFQQWIEILYYNIESCVTNNGHMSSYFKLSRGIRQGCCISAMLFLVVVELLADYLKSRTDIKGIPCDNEIFLVSQMADDTTLFLQDKYSIENVLFIMDRFYEHTGLRLNKQKCEVYLLGSCGLSNNEPNEICGVKVKHGTFKALGIYFGNDNNEIMKMNFYDRLHKFQSLLNMWSQRSLTLKGKITLLKSILLPTILYPCNNLAVPKNFIFQVNSLLFSFLWNNKPAKVKSSTIISDIQDGGLRMPYFPVMVQSGKIMWIKRLLDDQESKWKILAWKLLNMNMFDIMCKQDIALSNTHTEFYAQVINSWFEYHGKPPRTADELLNEIIWKNKFIKAGGKMLFIKKLVAKNCMCVKDIVSCEGQFLALEELQLKFGINFIEYEMLKNALPQNWKNMLRTNSSMIISKNYRVSFLEKVERMQCKTVYWNLTESYVKPPTALDQWYCEFPFLHDIDFKHVYILPSIITNNVRLQCFQYKILNRIFACNHMLNVWGIKDTNKCDYCGKIDIIEHYFFYCIECERLWSMIENWFNNITKVHIPLRVANVLFGIPYRKSQDKTLFTLNFIILHAKWFIFANKRENKAMFFSAFLRYLKCVLEVEKEIAIISNTKNFENNWSLIYYSL